MVVGEGEGDECGVRDNIRMVKKRDDADDDTNGNEDVPILETAELCEDAEVDNE